MSQAETEALLQLCEALSHLAPEVNIFGADGGLHEVDLGSLSPIERAHAILSEYEDSRWQEDCGRCDGSGCPACPNAVELFEEP